MLQQLKRSFHMADALLALLAISSTLGAYAWAREAPYRPAKADGPATVLLGSRSVQPRQKHLDAGHTEAFRMRARASGIAGVVHIYIGLGSTARAVAVGIYSNSKSAPGSLLSSGSRSTLKTHAWSTVSITPTRLVSGKTYWLAVLGEGGTLRYHSRSTEAMPKRPECPDSSSRAAAAVEHWWDACSHPLSDRRVSAREEPSALSGSVRIRLERFTASAISVGIVSVGIVSHSGAPAPGRAAGPGGYRIARDQRACDRRRGAQRVTRHVEGEPDFLRLPVGELQRLGRRLSERERGDGVELHADPERSRKHDARDGDGEQRRWGDDGLFAASGTSRAGDSGERNAAVHRRQRRSKRNVTSEPGNVDRRPDLLCLPVAGLQLLG